MLELVDAWIEAKSKENEYNRQRLDIEARILKGINLPEKGSYNVGSLKIAVRNKETWDQDLLMDLNHPGNGFPFWPFKIEYKPVREQLKTMEAQYPDKYRLIQTAVTIEPAKPSFVNKGEEQ